jgi:glyoxylase-like metal-dependent hydrolase (beta-lactamase superfamily II)
MAQTDSDGIRYPFATPPAAGQAMQVADRIWWIRLPLPMALDHVNVYALDDGDSWTIIDTGLADARTKSLWQDLLVGPLAAKPVRRLILTHHHPDHVGLAGWFIAQGAVVHMPRTAWLMARMLVLDVQDRPSDAAITFYRRAGMDPDELARRSASRPFNFADCVMPLPLGYIRLQDGATIHMGGQDWDIRMGHGHAPEHATFWARDLPLIIGGDQLLPSISANLGVHPTEPDADPVADWIASCTAFQPLARAEHLVLGGHKLPFTGLPLRLTHMIENHLGALDRLLAHLETPRSAGECFAPLFKRQIGPAEYGLALAESVAHLNHLHQTGRVSRNLRADGAWVYLAQT